MRERLRRQIQQRTEMLAGVSHDLRTPLTRMKLGLAMLDDGPEKRELEADVTEMERMIEGYLAFARGEARRPPRSISKYWRTWRPARGATPTSRSAGRRHEVELRPCHQAVPENLVSTRCYGTRSCSGSAAGPRSRSIDDNGPSIPPDKYEDVFRRSSGSTNRATSTPAASLGLAARDVARSHGVALALSAGWARVVQNSALRDRLAAAPMVQ
jgi:two-component system osmolarity sensor histidine kinase EnvZ